MGGGLGKLLGALLLLATAGVVGVQAVVSALDRPPVTGAPS